MSTTPRQHRRRGLLRTHAWLVATATLVTLVVAGLMAATSPVTYTSTAEVVVKPQPTSGAPIEPQMGTERAIAQSGAVAERAALRLGESAAEARAGLAVSVALETTVLEIQYTAGSARKALEGADAFTNAYLDFRNGDGPARVAVTVTDPVLPSHGNGANVAMILALAAMLGLGLGVGAAWLYDRISDRLRDADELEEQTGVPVLGELPRWRQQEGRLDPPRSARQVFGYVAAALLAKAGSRRHGLTVVVTSPRRGAGTTTVAVSTARTLAGQGRDVVLVGADVRDSSLRECLGVAAAPGLVDVLRGDCTAERALQRTSDPHLRVLAAGATREGGLRLHVDDLQLLLAQLGSGALVVVDAPPLLTWSDSLVLADRADLVLLVADLRGGTRTDAAAGVTLLRDLRPSIVGWVANRPPRRPRRPARAVEPARPAPVPDRVGSDGALRP
jgi:Mrp family chromosome partitioning ATPase